ncbi:MAG: hypothetical protein AAF518_15390 [Spirochaetota bacterium]
MQSCSSDSRQTRQALRPQNNQPGRYSGSTLGDFVSAVGNYEMDLQDTGVPIQDEETTKKQMFSRANCSQWLQKLNSTTATAFEWMEYRRKCGKITLEK